MTKYVTSKEKIYNFILSNIMPVILEQDIDFEKTVLAVAKEMHVSYEQVEHVLSSMCPEKMKEIKIHVLTIPDTKIDDWMKDLKSKEQRLRNVEKEVGL